MTRTPVKSSAIKSVGHDPETNMMEVEFQSGHVYTYKDVPEEAHADFISSTSIGKHFNNHIQGNYERGN